jgi:hypothetical protein
MLKKYTFSIEESKIEEFKKYCLDDNNGKYEPGTYSKGITNAINLLLASKKPKDETIDDIAELGNIDESPVQDFY